VSITRPADLAKELFTHKGSGTLVRRGEKVLRVTSWDELDRARLKQLIESSFGRELVPDYFDKTKLLRAYVSENYRTAVILTDEAEGVYLDKFAVLDDAQGRRPRPRGVERDARGNAAAVLALAPWQPDQHFYYAESDGCYKQDHWKVFWYGADGIDRISTYVDHCAQRAPSLQG
jgi:acetylglutamate kinase